LTNCLVGATVLAVVNQALLAENVRRAAGAHLVSLDGLASYIGLSRPAIMKLVAHKAQGRSLPSATTALKLAEAFAIDVRDLYSDPGDCLRAVAGAFERAPIRDAVETPEPVIPFTTKKVTVAKGGTLAGAGFPTTVIPRKGRTTAQRGGSATKK
jgi:DNA-binding XRE family transcriptional regulator